MELRKIVPLLLFLLATTAVKAQVVDVNLDPKNVTAITSNQKFKLKLRLYELEKQLPQHFIRISKSEIVNKYYIEKLLLEPNGLIRMYLKDAHLFF